MDTSKRLSTDKESNFPNLFVSGYQVTSPEDAYNCIAWAAGEENTDEWWDPFAFGHGHYWPQRLERNAEIETFVKLYAIHGGYAPCENGGFEPGFEKIAIFAGKDREVTHAARQLRDGTWTSKLGDWEDINHRELGGLSGNLYGEPTKFLKRPAAG